MFLDVVVALIHYLFMSVFYGSRLHVQPRITAFPSINPVIGQQEAVAVAGEFILIGGMNGRENY